MFSAFIVTAASSMVTSSGAGSSDLALSGGAEPCDAIFVVADALEMRLC